MPPSCSYFHLRFSRPDVQNGAGRVAVFRAGRNLALLAAIGLVVAVGPARAQGDVPPGALSEMYVPGGFAALAAIVDQAPDRSQFLVEFIRRTYGTPLLAKGDRREALRQSVLAHLDLAGHQAIGSFEHPGPSGPSEHAQPAAPGDGETLPLPLTPQLWIDAVFGGRATPQTLVQSIIGSREASLLYYGLLSLDDETRAWIAVQPRLITDVAARHAAAFAVAAPALRVSGGAMRVPGGSGARPAWEALIGHRTGDPAEFVRALLAPVDGGLAYFYGAMGQLTPEQIQFALNLSSRDPADPVAAVRRLSAVFQAAAWKVDQRIFARPSLDPALLVAELGSDAARRPFVPGTRAFWTAVFAGQRGEDEDPRALAGGEAVDFPWLCEQLFQGTPAEQRNRASIVLFASRRVRQVTPETARDAVTAVRAAGAYPALVATLERAGLDDVPAFAKAARRAAQLSAVGDHERAARAHAQYQGVLAVLTRAALRRSLPPTALPDLVSQVSAIELSKRGEYEGRLVRWLTDFIDGQARVSSAAGSRPVAAPNDRYERQDSADDSRDIDAAVRRLVAGPILVPAPLVQWEGTRYRVDVSAGESMRLSRLLGDNPRPYLSSARTLAVMADALAAPGLTGEALNEHAEAFAEVARSLGWDRTDGRSAGDGSASRGTAEDLQRALRSGELRRAARLGPSLRGLADDLLARGLLNVVYAAALGQPGSIPITADDAASRHYFGRDPEGMRATVAWDLPFEANEGGTGRGWHVAGSLLGLDVALSRFSLLRLSSKPPQRPTMTDDDRRVMTDAVALASPGALTDADRDLVIDALRKGRARVAAVRSVAEAGAIADEIRLGSARRSLLRWVAARDDRQQLATFLDPIELLWLGLENKPVEPALQAWGAPAAARLGCLCLQLLDRRPWDLFAGRQNNGFLASTFPDLNLRLAELLQELKMPAALLPGVLAAATLDFIDNATSRDPDDRRGPVAFVQALTTERVEEYLALLTTEGPLVPVADGVGSDGAGVTKPGGSQ
jgi:hypothetical protein